jgi:tRNA(Arg) A34 adenosine deaminase TadA
MTTENESTPAHNDPPRAEMIRLLRHANQIALDALKSGHHPFGAILVAPDNQTILSEQGNIDTLNHAESTLIRQAYPNYSPTYLWTCTLYTTVEPCVMCAGTLYWANVGCIVYGVSEVALLRLTGSNEENPTMNLPCRNVFEHGQKQIRVVGPMPEVEDEILALHRKYWNSPAPDDGQPQTT